MLGHALYRKAIHGGKAKNDRIDAQKIATLLRGGMLPQACAYPGGHAGDARSARRLHLVRKRGQLLAHIQMTAQQYNLPPLGKRIAYTNREGLARHFPDRAVRRSIEVDLALLERYDELLRELELDLVRQAKQHDPQAFQLLRSVPGIGKVLALTILYEVHDIRRFDRVQGHEQGQDGQRPPEVGLQPIHNNGSELALRRQAVGRKAWLFVGSDQAAEMNTRCMGV